jgi:DNA-3-methyladenine glycosylase I
VFVVLLRFAANKSQAPDHMADHRAWIQQGMDDGVFLLIGGIQPGQGGAVLAHDTTLDDLQKRVAADPFVAHEVVSAEIIEIVPNLTDPRLEFLADQPMTVFIAHDDEPRCAWAGGAPEFLGYHDTEWGYSVADDRRLFEKFSPAGFQSGLSWRTMLAKRENFRRGSPAGYFWRYEPAPDEIDPPQTASTSPTSVVLSKDLKRGWKFVGPTTVFAFMQAMGLVNDHVATCVIRPRVVSERSAFALPH